MEDVIPAVISKDETEIMTNTVGLPIDEGAGPPPPPLNHSNRGRSASMSRPPRPTSRLSVGMNGSAHNGIGHHSRTSSSSAAAAAAAVAEVGFLAGNMSVANMSVASETSFCSQQSREALRKDILRRRSSLLPQEHEFLEQLMVHGNEVEVTMAREKLADEDLFFEPENINTSIEQPDEDEDTWETDKIAIGKEVATSIRSTSEISRLREEGDDDYDDDDDREEKKADDSDHGIIVSGIPPHLKSSRASGTTPPLMKGSHGLSSSVRNMNGTTPVAKPALRRAHSAFARSAKAEQHLQARRSSVMYDKMWKAHETGLGLTQQASRKSVLRRSTSSTLNMFGTASKGGILLNGSLRMRNSSFLSTSTQDLLLNGGIHGAGEDAVFRHRKLSSSNGSTSSSNGMLFLLGEGGPSTEGQQQQLPNNKGSRPAYFRSSSAVLDRASLNRWQSDSSARSRRSVKFQSLVDEKYFDNISPIVPPRRTFSAHARAFSADHASLPMTPSPPKERAVMSAFMSGATNNSMTSTLETAPHHMLPSSTQLPPVPVIHKVPLRPDVSIGSIPSIRRGALLRGDSVTSTGSTPSLNLHRANPLRDQASSANFASSTSVASLNLHRANRIRSDDSVASLTTFDSEYIGPGMMNAEPAWSAPVPTKQEIDYSKGQLLRHPAQGPTPRPVLFRMASKNSYQGEGIEVTDWVEEETGTLNDSSADTHEKDILSVARRFNSMVSVADTASVATFQTAGSFDDVVAITRERDAIFRGDIQRSLSDDDDMLRAYFLGNSKNLFRHQSSSMPTDAEILLPRLPSNGDNNTVSSSWDMNSDSLEDGHDPHFDAWNVLNDEYATGYGGGGTLPFRILGTSAEDRDALPHVLSPPLLESLQNFLPYSICEENMWMKFSLIKHGSSMHTFLQHVRGAKYTIIGIETSDGEVFGSFTAAPWRKNWNYFGTGEAFLWRMRQSRSTPCYSILDQAQLESELDVYPWTGDNNCVQLCTHDKIAVGGGTPDHYNSNSSMMGPDYDGNDDDAADLAPEHMLTPKTKTNRKSDQQPQEKVEYGFGFAIDRDLHRGTSTHCATFGSPPLCKMHPDGSPFEIVNMEVWTTTPCSNLAEAEKLELGKLFLERTSSQ